MRMNRKFMKKKYKKKYNKDVCAAGPRREAADAVGVATRPQYALARVVSRRRRSGCELKLYAAKRASEVGLAAESGRLRRGERTSCEAW